MPTPPLLVANVADDDEQKSFSGCMKQENYNFEVISKLKPKSKPIIGKAQGKRLAWVTKKVIDLFVSRLKPTTVSEDVHGSVLEIFENDDGAHFDAAVVKCIKFDTMYDGYVSFRVTVLLLLLICLTMLRMCFHLLKLGPMVPLFNDSTLRPEN